MACKAAELDAQVMITSREQDKLTEAQRDFASAGLHVTGCIVDTADVSSITAFFDGIDLFDHLVSMAGGFMGAAFSVPTMRRSVALLTGSGLPTYCPPCSAQDCTRRQSRVYRRCRWSP
ncbi:SDR family oxidoreductase [Gluconobacter sphaericus]|uniref:hypothetical protein n=1 Tax=Gluconobacter sphaericus TaxID=574987 RepID=UPI00142E9AF4|nr:hypothetical protein [Gluconobacter sphaericus]